MIVETGLGQHAYSLTPDKITKLLRVSFPRPLSASVACIVLSSNPVRDCLLNYLDIFHHCGKSVDLRSVYRYIPAKLVRQDLLVLHRFPVGLLRLHPLGNLSHLPTNFPILGPDWRRYLWKSIQRVSITTYHHSFHRRLNCHPSESCSLEPADADVKKNKRFPSIWSRCYVSPFLSKASYIESI